MSGFTESYLAELSAALTAEIIKSLSGKLREKISGTPKAQAIERCLRIGLTALLATAKADSKDEREHLKTIFVKFFQDEKIGREIGVLLRGKPLRQKKLLALFEAVGFEAATLPGVNFDQAMTAFATAFQLAATDEPELQGTIKTKIGATSTVGCFPDGASRYGCEEMSGNVWEWTRSLWGNKYPYDPKDGREKLDAPDNVGRVLRGGSYYHDASGVRFALRYWYLPDFRSWYYGFRLLARPLSF
jgi:hypothetical protein